MGLEVGYWIFICFVTMLFKVPIMSVFVTGEDAGSIITIGVQYLTLMSVFYLWPAMTNGVQGFFRGIGRLKVTLLGTLIQTSVRVIMTYVLAPGMGIRGIAFACVAGWSLMLLVEVPLCVRHLRQVKEN